MRRLVPIVLLLSMCVVLHAEHLFEAGLRAGIAGYSAQCSYVSPVPDLHAGMQFSYAYHSPYVIGFRIAATLDRSKAGFSKKGYTDSYSVVDVENEPVQVDYSIGRLREMYTTWSVGIPLQLALSKNHFSLYVGPKFVFPCYTRWNETADNAALSVYFPLQDNRVYNSYPLAASPAFQELQEGASQSLSPVQFWLAAELCYDIPVNKGRRTTSYISVGIYFDYSFSAIQDEPSDRISLLMLSDTRDGFPLHRIMTPVVSAQRQGQRLVNNRKPYDVGLKIAYRIAPYNSRRGTNKPCRCYGI